MKNEMNKNTVFPSDGRRQDMLPLDFAATVHAHENSTDKAIIETAAPKPVSSKQQSAGPNVSVPTTPPAKPDVPAATAAPSAAARPAKALFQNFESNLHHDDVPAIMPAFRSATYPAGYVKPRHADPSPVPELTTGPGVAKKSEPAARAETKKNHPERQEKKTPSPGARQKGINIDIMFGKLLRDARGRLNLSIEQTAAETKIQPQYLEALESEDFNRLPPMVYICAYVRKLSALYKMEPAMAEEIIEALKKNLEVSLSEEIIASLDIDRELSQESEHKARNLYWTAAAAVMLFIGLISAAALMLLAPDNKGKTQPSVSATAVTAAPVPPFDPSRLENLKYHPPIPLSELSARR